MMKMEFDLIAYTLYLLPLIILVVSTVRAFTKLQVETRNQGKLLEKVGVSLNGKVDEGNCGERHEAMEKLHRMALQLGEDRMTRIEGSISEHGRVMMKSMDTLAGQVNADIKSMGKTLDDHLAANGRLEDA